MATRPTEKAVVSIAATDVGAWLVSRYGDVIERPLPAALTEILAKLEAEGDSERTFWDKQFGDELTATIPRLRAFALSLVGTPDVADDFVQETLFRAWRARGGFRPGTSVRAWTFVILRNAVGDQRRRSRFRGEWNDAVAERLLATPAGQDKQVELSDVRRALLLLPRSQQEVLILVGAGGLNHSEAAAICGCPTGTIKSRVARARATLEQILAKGRLPSREGAEPRGATGPSAFVDIMDQVEELTRT